MEHVKHCSFQLLAAAAKESFSLATKIFKIGSKFNKLYKKGQHGKRPDFLDGDLHILGHDIWHSDMEQEMICFAADGCLHHFAAIKISSFASSR